MRIKIPGIKTNLIEKLKRDYMDIGGLRLNFQRTCRVPEGQMNSLPAGLGPFPVYKVADFKSGAPKEWNRESFFMPLYRQEAMWISFSRGYQQNPKALIVAAGNINAISGKPFDPSKDKLRGAEEKRESNLESKLDVKLESSQNYLVVPPQPWIDGWKAEDGKVYQFVAAEMGSGETVEGQITGEEKVGGVQFIVYDPKEGKKLVHATRPHEFIVGGGYDVSLDCLNEESIGCFGNNNPSVMLYRLSCEDAGPKSCFAGEGTTPVLRRVQSMGLGRGGEIEQKIYPDHYGVEVWKEKPTAVEVIYLVSSEDFKQLTGHTAPPTPVTYEVYQQYGYPWFELHDKKYKDAPGADIFAKLKPVGEGKAPQGQPEEAVKEQKEAPDPLEKLNPQG